MLFTQTTYWVISGNPYEITLTAVIQSFWKYEILKSKNMEEEKATNIFLDTNVKYYNVM